MLTKTRYGIYRRRFNEQKFKWIRGYNTYMGALKALKHARYFVKESRIEVKIMPYKSYQPLIYYLLGIVIILAILYINRGV